jgi:hypothetical protein
MIVIAITKNLLLTKELKTIGIASLIYLVFVGFRDFFLNNLDLDFLISDVIFLFKYIFLSFMFVVVLKEKAVVYIVTVMAHLTVLSLFFYFFQMIGFAEELYRYSSALNLQSNINIEGYTNFVVFTFTKNRHDYANSGFSWEPGASGCFLILTLLLHFFTTQFRFDKKSKILILGIITTFSTTTYLAFIVLLFLTYRFRERRINRWFFILLPLFIVLLITVPFLGNKIVETYYLDLSDLNRLSFLEKYYHKQKEQIPLNRFGSLKYIYDTFQEKLILGVTNKYDVILNRKMDVNISNGIFDFLAKFGLVSYILLLYCYSKYAIAYVRKAELLIYCLLIFLIIGFGEPILHLPLVLIFLFLPLYTVNSKSRFY